LSNTKFILPIKGFEKISGVCSVCGTPLGGDNARMRAGNLYCAEDFEKTSPDELFGAELIEREVKWFKGIFKDQ